MKIYFLQKFKQDSEDAIEWPHLHIHSFTCNMFYLGAQGQLMPLFKGDTIKDVTARVTIVFSPINWKPEFCSDLVLPYTFKLQNCIRLIKIHVACGIADSKCAKMTNFHDKEGSY